MPDIQRDKNIDRLCYPAYVVPDINEIMLNYAKSRSISIRIFIPIKYVMIILQISY